eukprot:3931196-Pyramimonas_sp.AAC.1
MKIYALRLRVSAEHSRSASRNYPKHDFKTESRLCGKHGERGSSMMHTGQPDLSQGSAEDLEGDTTA